MKRKEFGRATCLWSISQMEILVAGIETEAWQLIRNDNRREGVILLEAEHQRASNFLSVMNLGVAYLWLAEYDRAWNHFQSAIEGTKHPPSAYYGMAGVAKWCKEDYKAAAEIWMRGFDAPANGGDRFSIHIPLLALASFSLRRNTERAYKVRAWDELSLRLRGADTEQWPEVLGPILLGAKQNVNMQIPSSTSAAQAKKMIWLADFYSAVCMFDSRVLGQLDRPDLRAESLKASMGRLADVSHFGPADLDAFLSQVFHEEYFIARQIGNEGHRDSASTSSDKPSPWISLRGENRQIGLDMLVESYRKDPSPSTAMSLGVGFLWIQDYEAALNHFKNAIESVGSTDSFFAMAGAALWSLDEQETAITFWRTGMGSEYADTSIGSVELRLLLFAASILTEGGDRNE